jgi:hypothetical protein
MQSSVDMSIGLPTMSQRVPLSISGIVALDQALLKIFEFTRTLRQECPAAGYIKYPSIPAVLTESLALLNTERFFGLGWKGRFGGNLADIIIEKPACSPRKIEIKATGRHAFQEFKTNDLSADAVVWFQFGARFETGTGPVEVSIIDNLGQFLTKPCRLDTRRFRAVPGIAASQRLIVFPRFEDLLIT